MLSENNIITEILQEAALIFLIIGSVFALLIGLLFLFSPEKARQFSLRYNRWLSLRKSAKPLEIPRSVEHHAYRQHRAIGLIILLSATYILYRFAFDYDQTKAIQTLTRLFDNTILVEWLLEAYLWFILPISGLLILFGATMALKPSALKRIESLSNRWISTRKAIQPIEKQYKSLDSWVERQPRIFGTILILAAGYNLAILFMFFINNLN